MGKMLDRWGTSFNTPTGYLAKVGKGSYQHRFGGDGVNIHSVLPQTPTLLLTLDLSDPNLSAIQLADYSLLPLCSFINSNGWEARQNYRILSEDQVEFVSFEKEVVTPNDADLLFPDPLPERPMVLEAMSEDDYPTSQENYYRAFDRFVGGDAIFRISGPPLFIDYVRLNCFQCNEEMLYIASVGYESTPSGLLIDYPFFIGEGVLYYFCCSYCRALSVVSQGT